MASPVIMPKQGQSVESCIITKWHKKEGDTVKAGELLFSFETDKAGFDETASTSGTLLAIFCNEDDEVPVLQTVAVIGNPGENIESLRPRQQEQKDSSPQDTPTDDETELVFRNDSDNSVLKISPRALELAQKLGVDFRLAIPSGPGGRIIEQDIDALYLDNATTFAAKEKIGAEIEGTGIGGRVTLDDIARFEKSSGIKISASRDAVNTIIEAKSADTVSTGEHETVPLSKVRKLIARSMHKSLANTAQLTLHSSFDATRIMDFRKKRKDSGASSGASASNITLTAIILQVVSRILPKHPSLNAHLANDMLYLYKNVNIGIAVDTPRGLLVPTLRDANKKSLESIAKETGELAESAKSAAINPDLLTGATFTLTNLGTFGVESFTPILNPPQTGILGVNTIVTRVREENGKIRSYPAMGLSLTFDHRAVDGAPAAKFLQELIVTLENFNPTGDGK
ncbi:MAG: 2-oxo acid dehydrogenase subunit E2 [Spirochaetaceae bacterium]|nr:MAG: 2-oxo acid dehydrogenase subunit E2 [Spirochaetaceae bacterium]